MREDSRAFWPDAAQSLHTIWMRDYSGGKWRGLTEVGDRTAWSCCRVVWGCGEEGRGEREESAHWMAAVACSMSCDSLTIVDLHIRRP